MVPRNSTRIDLPPPSWKVRVASSGGPLPCLTRHVCVFLTLHRYFGFFYPSTSSATGVRAYSSILQSCKLCRQRTTTQRYYVAKQSTW